LATQNVPRGVAFKWPAYGPKSLISDTNLKNVAKHAGTITVVDDLCSLVHIVHWSTLAIPLFNTVQTALATVTGLPFMAVIDATLDKTQADEVDEPSAAPAVVNGVNNGTFEGAVEPTQTPVTRPIKVGKLLTGEQVM